MIFTSKEQPVTDNPMSAANTIVCKELEYILPDQHQRPFLFDNPACGGRDHDHIDIHAGHGRGSANGATPAGIHVLTLKYLSAITIENGHLE